MICPMGIQRTLACELFTFSRWEKSEKKRLGGKRGVRSAECGVRSAEFGKCGVWKVRSVESAECGKCGVWKMRSVENAGCGKCGVENI